MRRKENEKQKKLYYLISILIVILSCIGVFFGLKYFVKKPVDIYSEGILFTKQDLVRVDASLATQPLVDAFIFDFTGKSREEMGVEYTNTHPGYVKLINNEADLIVVTEPSKEELELAKEKNIELEVTPVVNEGFVFFVNKENKVNDVKLDDIRKIYTGEIDNWKELGGVDEKIIAYQRPTNSGSQTGLLSLVMNGLKVKIPVSQEQISTISGIVDIVADYNNGINSIGYSYYYYANTMYKNDNLKYLAINGVEPNYTNIQNGAYPIRTAYYIVTRKGETNEQVLKLKEAMLSSHGQKVASEAGYAPVK